jgi:hypothetical protein
MAGEERPQRQPESMAEHAVEAALRRRADRLEKRAGRIAPRSASGLEIGPQRYHDPSIWGPNHELREAPLGSIDDAYRGTAHLLAELDPHLADHDVGEEQVIGLTETMRRPSAYVQRCVEHVTFPDQGGQHWTSDLQIRIPDTMRPAASSQRIAPLGQFVRRHLPDFAAFDCEGRRLSMLTPDQHALALAKAVLDRQVDSLPGENAAHLSDAAAQGAYELLRSELLDFMTTVGDFPEPAEAAMAVAVPYAHLLDALAVPPAQATPRIADLANQLAELLDSMPRLAWIEAGSGELLHLQVTYSTRDPKHNPAYDGSTPFGPRLPDESYASLRADIHRDIGLGPIKHEFDAPGPRHAGSYSFTIEPPDRTSVMYLDWETGNSIESKETTSCSLFSAHLPDGGRRMAVPSAGARVRAFLRVSPHQRVQILAATLLNLVVIWLLRDGHVPGHLGDPVQGFIVAAPSGLIAYLVSQQRHYYAYPMRRQRGILWGYLAVSLVFVVTVALSEQNGRIGYDALSPEATAVAWVLFVSSVAVFFWYLPLGFGFNWTVGFFVQRRWRKDEESEKDGEQRKYEQRWEAYVVMYQRYGRVVFYLVFVAALAALWFLMCAWDGSPSDPRTPPRARSVLVQGAGGPLMAPVADPARSTV